MTFVNWPEAYMYLHTCEEHKAKFQLLKFVHTKIKIKPVRPKIKFTKGEKVKSLSQLKKELDKVFSIFIRERDSNELGDGFCCTCGKSIDAKYNDCGHYLPRQDLATRWEEKNCALQCKICNGFRGGESEKFAEYIDNKYGFATAAHLRWSAKSSFKPTRQWYEMKIKHYKEMVK